MQNKIKSFVKPYTKLLVKKGTSDIKSYKQIS